MISYPAPSLCQFSDEEMILLAGEIVFPGAIARWPGENGLRIWVEGWDQPDERAEVIARDRIHILLGLLRTWRAGAGELKQERWRGLGDGSRRDPDGNQWVQVGPTIEYVAGSENELRALAEAAATGIEECQFLRNALWLNGRANRTAADYYMIHEYASKEFSGTRGVRASLGVSRNEQERLTQSANNLSPLDGGRHAREGAAPWSLDQCRSFAAALLREWVKHHGSG